MHTDMQKLKAKIVECRMTQESFAHRLGINVSTLYRKMKAEGVSFTIGEMHQIVEILGLTVQEANQIFLQ